MFFIEIDFQDYPQTQFIDFTCTVLHIDFPFFRLVIETLDKVDKDRRCFRLVGGVLVERKVGEVEPALIGNSAKVTKGFPV